MSKEKGTEKVSLEGFLQFIEYRSALSFGISQLRDGRSHPQIPLKDAVLGMVLGTALGTPSFHELDGQMKDSAFKRVLGCTRERVASDTTLFRLCEALSAPEVSHFVEGAGRVLAHQGLVGRRDLAGRRVDVVDGTCLGGHEVAMVVRWGEPLQVRALAPIRRHGQERPVSCALLQELAEEPDCAPRHVVADDLYSAEPFFAACDRLGAQGIVKTHQSDFIAVQQAEGAFAHKDIAWEQAWVDAKRARKYRVRLSHGFCWAYRERVLSIARVDVTELKGSKAAETYWILSQDESLSPQELVALVEGRWFIENNGFRTQNEQAASKHLFSHNPHTAFVIAALQWLARMLLGAYKAYLERFTQHLRTYYDHRQISWRTLRRLLRLSLIPASAAAP